MEKKIWLLVIVLELLGLCYQGWEYYQYRQGETVVSRKERTTEEEYLVTDGSHSTYVALDIPGQTPDEAEMEELFQRAEEEIDATFLGDNPSTDEILGNVILMESYAGGKVTASWSTNPRGIFSRTGEIRFDQVSGDTLVEVEAELECYGQRRIYAFSVLVLPPSSRSQEGFAYLVTSLFQGEEAEAGDEIALPQSLEGTRLKWNRPMEYTGFLICLLGILGALVMKFGGEFDARQRKEKEKEDYVKDYPGIVSGLVLYVGAGMSVRGAFERMGDSYLRQKRNGQATVKKAYENIVVLNRQLKDGQLETKVYEEFGKRCVHPAYTKLSMMLTQNSRKGNTELLLQLEKEEQNLYEERQRKLKAAGEITSTKLLLPMGGLLLMVLIVVIVPAFWGMTM